MLSPPAAYTPSPPSFYASKWDSLIWSCTPSLPAKWNATLTSAILWTATGSQKVDICALFRRPQHQIMLTPVAFGWIAGYLVLNVCLYRVIPCHGYSQRGSDFVLRLGKILNGVALVRYIPYICVTLWSDYRYKGHSLHFIRCLYRNFYEYSRPSCPLSRHLICGCRANRT